MQERAPIYYEAEISWKGQREGDLQGKGLPGISVDAPPEFNGQQGRWTPEHLFVASVNSCFMITFLVIAENSRLEIVTFHSTARGKLETVEDAGYRLTEIAIRPRIVIRSAGDLGRAARIVEKAKNNCIVSNSINSRVTLHPEIYNEQVPSYPCPMVSGAES